MKKLLKSFKTEINPTPEQKIRIHKTIGTCRFIYNFYLAHNKELYDNGEKFMSSNKFRVWLNHEYLSKHPEYSWIKEVYSKAVTQAVNNGQTAFTRFFNHESAFPNFKKKGKSDVKMYFVKNNPKDCRCERHRINIPSLGWVRIKEKGYIPTTKDGYVIKSGTVSMKADRYYVSVLVELPDNKTANNSNEGIGIDRRKLNLDRPLPVLFSLICFHSCFVICRCFPLTNVIAPVGQVGKQSPSPSQ